MRCPVHRFLEGVEGEQSVRGVDRRLKLARLTLLGQQSGQALEYSVAQSRPLAPQPRLPWLLLDAQSGQEVAAVQRNRLLERRRSAVVQQPREGRHVEIDAVDGNGHGIAFDAKD
jgi:hypothetical protein